MSMTSHLSLAADNGRSSGFEPPKRTRQVLDILERLHGCTDVEGLQAACVDTVERALPGGAAALFANEPEAPVVRLAAAGHRWRSAEREAPAWLSRLSGPISALVKAQSRVSGGLVRCCDLADVVHEGGLHLASVPVCVNGGCTASLVVVWPSASEDGGDAWLLERIAHHLAIAWAQVLSRGKAERRLRDLEQGLDERVRHAQLLVIAGLAAKTGHAFNNTLTTVLGTTEWLLTAQALEPDIRADIEAVQSAALEARQFVRRLQGYCRRAPAEEREAEDLATLSVAAMEAFRLRLAESQHALEGQVEVDFFEPPRPITVRVNVPEIRDVIADLLQNAADAMPRGGRVAVRTGGEKGLAWVSVTDAGAGMSEDVLSRVFEPFFTTKGRRSLGLSLCVCRDVALAHGGRLDLTSAPGLGTTATLWLPAVAGN